ncbi:hypothetical protein HNQ50_000100 [Silvimonas terrae]|uniref:Uncharacterized protein n=1 Tax=Silvimonas terrae TaxID=300266 RepID=A0A840RAM6_9NEIS|nr:hypothetical protein [Silvimonas terrae]MBB5189390.1 hypothetical protein [Silvimonas terrae]
MTVIAPISTSLLPVQTTLAPTNTQAATLSLASQPSVMVNLGTSQAGVDSQTYSAQGTLYPGLSSQLVWKNAVQDPVSILMGKHFMGNTLADRFKGLGAALLDGFSSGSGNYSQSVKVQNTDGISSGNGLRAGVSLQIKTNSGTLVTLSIDSQADGMDIQVSSDSKLSDEERAAIAGLADGFQNALDGLSQQPPRLDLAGLAGYDTHQLKSVDLQLDSHQGITLGVSARVHLDRQTSSVNVSMPQGKMALSVNNGNIMGIQGSAGQRAAAVANMLKQLDDAASRGHGDPALVNLFKDAFTTLNGKAGATNLNLPLDDREHAMLTGLSDFTASITDTPVSSNPLHLDEVDKFEWTASQSTTLKGNTMLDHTLSQTQKTHLTAAWHRPLVAGTQLRLTTDPDSQNYYFDQVDDSAQSQADLAMQNGQMVSARVAQSADQSLHETKVVKNKVMADQTTPTHNARTLDLLGLLQQTPRTMSADEGDADQNLRKVHGLVLLSANPRDLG